MARISDVIYEKSLDSKLHREAIGGVIDWSEGIAFWCPCGTRQIYIKCPPHKRASFDEEGLLTVKPSIGAHANPEMGWPVNWCHFFIRDGKVDMCADSGCPGNGGTAGTESWKESE